MLCLREAVLLSAVLCSLWLAPERQSVLEPVGLL